MTAHGGATVRHEDVGHDDLTVRHERDFSELHHDRDRCMAPARPLLRAIREKAVVASNGRETEVADGILRYPCLDEGLSDRSAEIEHAGIPHVSPPELRAKTLHELLGDLIFVTEDMRTDICPNGACRACCGLAQDVRSFGRDAGDRPLPSRVNDREPAWAGEHNRHAVGEAQHHRDMRGDAHNGIGTLGYLLAHAGELIIRYDARSFSYADFSGRGALEKNAEMWVQKPDLAAPGVRVTTAKAGGGYGEYSGTSFAVPFVTGSAALLMEWGIIRGNDPYLYGEKVKAYLRRGARHLPGYEQWPNNQLGYGVLCVEESLPF